MMQGKWMRALCRAIAAASLVFAVASAAHADTVGGLQMKGLGNYVGKYLTVYYAIGGRASINTQGDQIHIRKVKAKKTIQISGDTVTLPPVEIPRVGWFLPYNIMVFVVHDGADFRWVNADATIPENETATGPTQYLTVDSLTKMEFESLQQNANYLFGESK
jgi:hypothetical protein